MDNVSYAYGFQNLKYITKQKKLDNHVRCILGMERWLNIKKYVNRDSSINYIV